MHADTWPVDELRAQLGRPETVGGVLRLLFGPRDWIVRRKEQLEFESATQVRRRMSMTLLVPEQAPEIVIGNTTYRVLPLTYVRKRKLISFDLRTEAGSSMSMLPTSFGRTMARDMLVELVEELFEGTGDVVLDLKGLFANSTEDKRTVHTDEQATKQSVDGIMHKILHLPLAARALEKRPQHEDLDQFELKVIDAFRTLLLRFALNLLCLVLVEDQPGTLRVLKYTLTEPIDTRSVNDSLHQRIAMRLGWRPWQIHTPIPAAVNAKRHHIEMTAPEGTEILIGRVVGIVSRDERLLEPPKERAASEDSSRWAAAGSRIQDWFHLTQRDRTMALNRFDREPKETSDYPVTSLHLAMSLDTETAVKLYAVFAVRLTRKGWLRVSLCCCVVATAVLLLLGFHAAAPATGTVSPGTMSSPSPIVLLLGLLSLAAAMLTRSSEHALASEMLTIIRWLVILVCLAPVVAAVVVLSTTGREVEMLKTWFRVLGTFCAVVTSMLFLTFLRCAPIKESTLQRKDPTAWWTWPWPRRFSPLAVGRALRSRRGAQLLLALRFNEQRLASSKAIEAERVRSTRKAEALARRAEVRGEWTSTSGPRRVEPRPLALDKVEPRSWGVRFQSAPYSIDRNVLFVAPDVRMSGLRIGTAEANRYALRDGWDQASYDVLQASASRIARSSE